AYVPPMSKTSFRTKIVTCCYCGGRSTLAAGTSAALVCHACGAPISRIKALEIRGERLDKKRSKKHAMAHPAERRGAHLPKDRPVRRKKGKRKSRSFWYHVREAFDDVDDLFDIFD
ncbi:MAG: hypothetical protein AAF409_21530, partial [Pseudomonadota bacterium]